MDRYNKKENYVFDLDKIEKELLAILVGCTKFQDYIIGRSAKTIVETDHKPLESIVKKPLYSAPARLQKMLIQLQRYPEIEVKYIKGKDMIFADPLSRAYLPGTEEDIKQLEVNMLSTLPISSRLCDELISATSDDSTLTVVKDLILEGWPENKSQVPPQAAFYWQFREELSYVDGLLFKASRVIIPSSMRKEMLSKLHKTHQGMVKSKQRARDTMFWPAMNKDIENTCNECNECLKYAPQNKKEPLKPHKIPDRPWDKVGTDLFSKEGKDYIVVIDYYSKWIEVKQIPSKTSKSAIKALKSIFSRQGIPSEVMSDNGPCYNSSEFAVFCQEWDINHNTSSPGYPQSNGQAESAVKTVSNMMQKCKGDDILLALLEYRTTPLPEICLSPSQMLNSRRLRSILPTAGSLLTPQVQPGSLKRLKSKQARQKFFYDRTALKKPSKSFKEKEAVRIYKDDQWKPATVVKTLPHNSYLVSADGATYRRTRSHLRHSPSHQPAAYNTPDQCDDSHRQSQQPATTQQPALVQPSTTPSAIKTPQPTKHEDSMTISKYGRVSKPTSRLIEEM